MKMFELKAILFQIDEDICGIILYETQFIDVSPEPYVPKEYLYAMNRQEMNCEERSTNEYMDLTLSEIGYNTKKHSNGP